jgi:ankyrin repeat protein
MAAAYGLPITRHCQCLSHLKKTNSPLLFIAAYEGDLELMKELIEGGGGGADINYADSEAKNAFFYAMLSGSYDCAKLLSDYGFDINNKDKNGESSIWIEVHENNFKGVKFLLEHNADINIINKDGITLLMMAACYGHTLMMEMLIESGANLDIVDEEGHDFMNYVRVRNVINGNFLQMTKFLEEHSCNIKPAKR